MPPQAMNTDFLRTYVGTHASKMLNIFGLEVKNQDGKVLAVTDEVSRLLSFLQSSLGIDVSVSVRGL